MKFANLKLAVCAAFRALMRHFDIDIPFSENKAIAKI
jgi:hypothetical protein